MAANCSALCFPTRDFQSAKQNTGNILTLRVRQQHMTASHRVLTQTRFHTRSTPIFHLPSGSEFLDIHWQAILGNIRELVRVWQPELRALALRWLFWGTASWRQLPDANHEAFFSTVLPLPVVTSPSLDAPRCHFQDQTSCTVPFS